MAAHYLAFTIQSDHRVYVQHGRRAAAILHHARELGLAESFSVRNNVLEGSELSDALGPDLAIQYFLSQQTEHLAVQLRITLEVWHTGQLFDPSSDAWFMFERDRALRRNGRTCH